MRENDLASAKQSCLVESMRSLWTTLDLSDDGLSPIISNFSCPLRTGRSQWVHPCPFHATPFDSRDDPRHCLTGSNHHVSRPSPSVPDTTAAVRYKSSAHALSSIYRTTISTVYSPGISEKPAPLTTVMLFDTFYHWLHSRHTQFMNLRLASFGYRAAIACKYNNKTHDVEKKSKSSETCELFNIDSNKHMA